LDFFVFGSASIKKFDDMVVVVDGVGCCLEGDLSVPVPVLIVSVSVIAIRRCVTVVASAGCCWCWFNG